LLTFWEQGCEQFEPEMEAGSEETRRTRLDFENEIENVLRDALGQFTKAEVAKVNQPFTDDEFHVFRHEDKLDTVLFSKIPCLFQHAAADFDRLQAAEEMAAETPAGRQAFLGIGAAQFGAVVEERCLSDLPAG
jgi:hypothetical protein